MILAVEPFPFVPAIWMVLRFLWGLENFFKSFVILPKPGLIPKKFKLLSQFMCSIRE